ncbi:MAG: flavin reductase family protein [Bacteroidota bacterium]|jgi:flavin reductase (DIM6/NTAB) family NADH-FMN oxidoreductase RutF
MQDYRTYNPEELKVMDLQALLQGAIAPRPVCFASTIDKNGHVNLSPFSFFNIFSTKPPILIFSPARRGRDNTTKHTLENVLEVPEVCINVVTYSMVQQTSLASTEYPKGTNEFIKAGFTQEPSVTIKPPRVKESPVQLECVVNQVIPLGTEGGAGNLVICQVKLIHVNPDVLTATGRIDQEKIDLVARMGGDWYARAHGSALFEVPKPLTTLGMGVDQLPDSIKNSTVLTGNDLGMLANTEELPDTDSIEVYIRMHKELQAILTQPSGSERTDTLHRMAHELLLKKDVTSAWKVVLSETL